MTKVKLKPVYEDVKPEIIEQSVPQEISVITNPGSIIAEFSIFKTKALQLADEAKTLSLDNCDIRTLKANSAYLGAQAKTLDSIRIQSKKEYLKPFEEFEARAKELTTILKDGQRSILDIIKDAEEAQRRDRENRLREFYEDAAGVLVPVVPFEKILDPKWLNKSYAKNPEDEILAKVEKIAADWEMLKGSSLEHYEAAEREFFDSLDLGVAISKNASIKLENERIAAMKAELEEIRQPEPVPEPVVNPVSPSPTPPETPVKQQEGLFDVRTYQITTKCTEFQLQSVISALKALGLTGAIKDVTHG